MALIRAQLEQARIQANISSGVEQPVIAGNLSQLKQLFLNLFVNAVEAMPAGGRLSVRVAAYVSNTRRISVEIRDTGMGIPDNVMGAIFDPFITTKPRGSGLGLSICRGIADAHRATIQAKNNEGTGATITVDFPALDDVHAVAMSTYQSADSKTVDRN
jgi:two-component system NtrC family sensor kinase